jgi:serine/threonine protein kinase
MKVQDRSPECLGPYRLNRRLGEGGMGVVYLAADAAGQPVAVKALHPGMAQDENARRRLAREVETMRRVRSRYVAEVVDADLSGDSPYIVTRYVPGLTLDQVVTDGGPLTGDSLARLACGLAAALTAVHSAGVVHRDLKPGNVMIADGEPVVIDFGIAQLPDTTRLTMTGMFMGTPGYLAPEVIEGQESGPASDMHSLGATLAFAATGRPPFGTGSYEMIFYRIMHGTPDLDTLPTSLLPIVLSALSRDPASRPSAAELAAHVATIDPATLVPSPPSLIRGLDGPPTKTFGGPGAAVPPGPPGRTVSDGPGQPAWPSSTRPMPSAGPEDVRDLLPPVTYGSGGNGGAPGAGAFSAAGYAATAGAAGTGSAAVAGAQVARGGALPAGSGAAAQAALPGGAGLANGAAAAVPGSARPAVPSAGAPAAGSATAWSPLVFAMVAVAVAFSIAAPILGTAISLIVLIALRAASTTARQLYRRRSGDGPRPSDPAVAVALYPLALLRSLFGLLLLSPIAVLGFCVAVAITIIVVPVHPLPEGVALGAGALVALVGLGPGSSGSRIALASVFNAVSRTRTQRVVAYAGVLALAIWAVLTAWSQPTPAYFPVASLHDQLVHLPTIRMMVTDARNSLLAIARHLGL